MPTTPTSADWSDEDVKGADGTADLAVKMVSRLRALEAREAANRAEILVIQARLNLINALLHLW